MPGMHGIGDALIRLVKAAVNAPQSRRFARFADTWQTRERLDCGGFSTAFMRRTQSSKTNLHNAPIDFCRPFGAWNYFWNVNPGRRSFHFVCPGLSSVGLSALWFP